MPLYFIAVVASPGINERILQDKLWMKDNFGTRVALRSPAHITLVPPFHLSIEQEKVMVKDLQKFVPEKTGFMVMLKDYNYFAPRVIYVDVLPSSFLSQVKNALQDFLLSAGHKIKKDDRPFHPHITIANRDLERKDFYEAKKYFDNQVFEGSFIFNNISLLRSEPQGWVIAATISYE